MVDVITLLNHGHLSKAWASMRALGAFPAGGHESLIYKLLAGWFSLTPHQQASVPKFKDDLYADFQFVPAARSDQILLVFCGMAQRFGGCPLPLIHCLTRLSLPTRLWHSKHIESFHLSNKTRHWLPQTGIYMLPLELWRVQVRVLLGLLLDHPMTLFERLILKKSPNNLQIFLKYSRDKGRWSSQSESR
jgi:hypothetical protein